MGRPRKVPAVLVEATVKRNAKLAGLPSDAARLGYFYVVLGDAKLSEPVPGQFASRAVFRDVAGRWARYLDDYIAAGLLEVAPRLCPRCKAQWSAMPPKAGVLVVHDWHEHQYDPRKLERQREYEDRQRAGEDAAAGGVSDGVSDAHSDGVSDANPTGFPTPDSRAGARGGGRRGAPNVERGTTNGISPEENPGARERADVQALLDRGWPKVTKAQRRILDEVLERHDVTGPAFAAEVIRSTPPDADPLEAVIAADRLWQDAQAERVAAEEAAWSAEKAAERAEAERNPWLADVTT